MNEPNERNHNTMSYANLIADLEKSAAKIAKLQADLAAEQDHGKELLKEFQNSTSALGKQFGLFEAAAPGARRGKRAARSVLSRVLTSVTRAINSSSSSDMATEQAEKAWQNVCKKKGYVLSESEQSELKATIADRIKSEFGEPIKAKGKGK